ncbi:alpha/beta hydrolase [Microbacterium aurantiacum]|uniref:Alpha/beta hydrolase n=1 Tax=Microbacterium aurantiacum TaxID=162393 RepID=A0ABT8FVL4_9MICO|nr:alpha/beta hydrolase [Microbacterium aurantiacum]MDN4465359.1 alpha/beta hydrolase [Microbacterium aurantiacum]
MYFPGGGWVLGDNDANDLLARRLARATGLTIYLVEYSKAPEHPFPAAVEDAQDVIGWVARAAPGLSLHVGGDSAGANLAAVATLAAREGGPPIASQILFYPPTDACYDTYPQGDAEANSGVVTAELMAWFWRQYVSDPVLLVDPRVSPLRAPNLRGLPPTLLVTAEHDILRDEGEEYGRRLEEAGVHVTHRRFEGQMHGFLSFVDVLPASDLAIAAVGEWIAGREEVRL